VAGTLIASLLAAALALGAAPKFVAIEGKDLVTGKEFRVDSPTRESPVVAVFVSSRCPCSASHEQELKKLAVAYPQARFVGVHSNADETVEQAREHFARSAFPFPIVRDEGAVLADLWGALKTPHAYVFVTEGELAFQGGVDDSKQAVTAKKRYLADALDAIKGGKKPDPSVVRTLGCVIKR
jgi:hypothetical protein